MKSPCSPRAGTQSGPLHFPTDPGLQLTASLDREPWQVSDYPRHSTVCEVGAQPLGTVNRPHHHGKPTRLCLREEAGAGNPPAPAAERREPLMDGQEISATSFGEIERQPFIALRAASEPARPEQQPAPRSRIEVLDGADHRLLERRVQEPVARKPPRRRIDHLCFETRFLDLDVDRDPSGAEIQDRFEPWRLVAAQTDESRVGQQGEWDSPARRVVMDHEDAVGSPAHVELDGVRTLRDRRFERRGCVCGSVAGSAAVRDDQRKGGDSGHPDRMNVRDPPVRPAADREDLQ